MGDMSKEPSMEEILSSIKRIIAEEGDLPAPRAPRRGRLEVVPSEGESEVETAGIGFPAEEDAAEDNAAFVAEDEDVLELTPEAEIEASAGVAEEEVFETEAFETGAFEAEDEIIELTPPEMPEAVAELAEAEPEAFEPEAEDQPEEAMAEPEAFVTEPEEDMTAGEPEAPAAEPSQVAEEALDLTDPIQTEEPVTLSSAALSTSGTDAMISVESEVAARHSLSALSSMVVAPEGGETNTLEGMVREMIRPMLKEWLDARLPSIVESMVAKEIQRITGNVR